jgi:putative transposase
MSANWKNYYKDCAVHHITGTVHGWQPVLLSPDILSIFTTEFNRKLVRWDVQLFGFVIMPEHFHMLVQSERAENILNYIRGGRRSISGKVRWLIEENNKAIAAFYPNHDVDISVFYLKTGGKSRFRFWKEKPRVFPISREEDVINKLDYIHNNPVRRGLVKSPEDWEHSSFRYYCNGSRVELPVYCGYEDSGVRMSSVVDGSPS